MSWKDGKLGDYIKLNYGKGLPERNRKGGSIPVYGSGGEVGRHNKPLIAGPGIIVGRKGTIGSVYWESRDFFPIDTTYYVTHEDGILKRFAYYLLKSLPLSEMNTNAAVPGLNRDNAHRVDIRLPDKDIQQSIADILEDYDDLIENNKRRIELLEESARQLYKEWFVRFRFPGHEHVKIIDGVPEGWQKKTFKDLLTLNYGKALKADNRIPGDIPVYGSSGVVGSHNKALVKGPGIIVGRKGNVGAIHWSHLDFFPIDTVYFISAEESSYFIYYALMYTTFINTDVAVPGLNRDFAYSREIIVPTDTLREEFEEEVTPIFKQYHTLEKFNDQLVKARDLLLPKLMSGEIAV